MPRSVRRCAIHAELVSTIWLSRSSEPMDTISALGMEATVSRATGTVNDPGTVSILLLVGRRVHVTLPP